MPSIIQSAAIQTDCLSLCDLRVQDGLKSGVCLCGKPVMNLSSGRAIPGTLDHTLDCFTSSRTDMEMMIDHTHQIV